MTGNKWKEPAFLIQEAGNDLGGTTEIKQNKTRVVYKNQKVQLEKKTQTKSE